MRLETKQILALALLGGGALWMTACGGGTTRGSEEPSMQPAAVEAEVPGEAPPAGVEGPGTASGEVADTAAEPAQPEPSEKERELALKERELEVRERELALEEARLAEQKAARRSTPRPTQPPAPAAEPRPEPVPEPEAAEPVTETAAAPAPLPEPEPEPREVLVRLPAGTELEVEFLSRLASDLNQPGDTFRARVIQPISEGGVLAVPADSEVVGRVVEAVSVQNKVGGQARLALEFTDLVLPSGTTAPIEATFAEQAKKETGKDAATIGGAAAAGALLGRILDRGDSKTKGTIIGAVVGAAAGTAAAAKTRGNEVEIPDGWVTRLVLGQPVELWVRR
jgi:hypothetical protein